MIPAFIADKIDKEAHERAVEAIKNATQPVTWQYPLTWDSARAALDSGDAIEVEAEHDRYLYRVEEGVVMVAPFGARVWCAATYEPHQNAKFRVSVKGKPRELHEKMTEPKPMSPEERRKLRVALAEGKVCWIEWEAGNGTTKRHKFKLTENFNLYAFDDGEWRMTGIGADKWLSWSEVREPRVFEFEDYRNHPFPDELGKAIVAGARFNVRYEEILEETT